MHERKDPSCCFTGSQFLRMMWSVIKFFLPCDDGEEEKKKKDQVPVNGPFLGKDCHFHFVLHTFLVLKCLYFYDPLLLSHILLSLWTQNLWAPSLSSTSSEAESWLTRAHCLEMNFPWPQTWICFSKNTRFLLLPRDANPDPEPGQDPIVSTWDVT